MFGFKKENREALIEEVKKYIDKKYSDVKYSLPEKDLEKTNKADKYSREEVNRVLSEYVSNGFFYLGEVDRKVIDILDAYHDLTFAEYLIFTIREKKLSVTKIYKKANVDRRLYSKVMSTNDYKPSKDTCIALALAIEMDVKETNELLSRAGYALSHSIKRDIVIEYFIENKIYDINKINEVLYSLEMKLLGR